MYRSAQEPGSYVSSEMLVLDKPFYTGDFKSTANRRLHAARAYNSFYIKKLICEYIIKLLIEN